MSALRDVRLLIARHLDLPTNQRAGILDVLNLVDAELDAQGFQGSQAIDDALARLDHIILNDDDLPEDEVEDDDIFNEAISLEQLLERSVEVSDED